MQTKTIEMIQSAMSADEENQKDFRAYDDMDNVRFDFGDLLESWMIPSVSTDGMESLKVLANIFDTYNPTINVVPFGEGDSERAEKSERWAEYQVMKINQRASASPFRKLPHMAGKYNRIVAQVDYLPYWIPKSKDKWSKEQKEQMRAGPFCVEVHNPQNVWYSMGKYGLRWAVAVTNMCASEIKDHWAVYDNGDEDSKKLQAALDKIEAMEGDNEEIRFIHVDFSSYDKREVSVFPTTMKDSFAELENWEEGSKIEKIDLIDKENKLDFLNWVVIEGESTPLLSGIHKGGLYQKKTLYDTIVHSSVMRRAYPPLMISETQGGKGINVDYSGADPEVRLKPGEKLTTFTPPPLDNGVFTLASQVSQQVDSATGVKRLAGMDIGGNLQYSTVNALIDLQLTNIEPYKRLSEKGATGIVLTMFKWIKFSGDDVVGYRTKKTIPEQIQGEEIIMTPDDFDFDKLLLEVTFTSKSDKMQQINMISQLKQNGFRVPDAELLEKVGFKNPEVLADQWEVEQIQQAALQEFIQQRQMKQQLEMEAQQMQMQAQMQQEQMMQQQEAMMAQDPNAQGGMGQMANPDQGAQGMPSGQGFNAAMGGDPSMMANPGMTATQVPGERQQ